MEVLSALISEADQRGVLTPLPGTVIKFRASIYNDELVIFLAPTTNDFVCIRDTLQLFTAASGLATNIDKCTITPICCTDKAILTVQQVFPCKLQEFPMKYLGAPLSLHRLSHNEEQVIMDVITARIPPWKAGLLTNAGRATLAKTTLSAIPMHVSICCSLSPWALGAIDKRQEGLHLGRH